MSGRSVLARTQQFLRRNFLAGLLAILPLVITIWIIRWLVDVLEGGAQLLPRFLRPDQMLPVHVPGLGALVTVGVIVAIGFVASSVLIQRLTRYANDLLLGIPVFRGIYSAVKRLVEAILHPQRDSFRRVVLIEYPRRGMYTVALMTGITEGEVQERTAERLLNVFVPTTPNPTSGYYVLVPESDIVPLSMTVEEAFKLVMSGGIVTPERREA